MNYKTLFTAIFAVILLLSSASAITLAQVGSAVVPSSATTSATSFTISFTLNNTGADGTVDFSTSSMTSPSGATISFSPASGATILSNQTQTFVATVTFTAGTGSVAGTIVADPAGSGSNVNIPFSVSRTVNFCKSGEQGGNLSISNLDISSDGEDDTTWRPLDTVKIEVDVENNGDDDIKDVVVELGLYDSSGKNQIGDIDFINSDEEQFDIGTIKDGDEETATFEFRIPADIDDGNYKLKIKAYSDKLGEAKECVDTSSELSDDTFEDIEVELESDEGKYIAFDNVEFNPTEATCGDQVTLAFDAYNIGDEDQDRVNIFASSKDLKFDMSQEIVSGLDQGDHESMLFTFTVPQGLVDKTYKVDLSSEYDYRSGVYRQESDETDAYSIKIFGCGVGSSSAGSSTSTSSAAKAALSASLDSEAKAGENLKVTATITNRLSTEASYVISASGYDDWASLKSISDRIVTLGAGESTDVTLTFAVSDDAAGEQSFTLEATNGNVVSQRDVVVSLAESQGFSLGGNSLFWGIAIVNVVLLIAIVLVAIRLSRN
ncbi:MAG TPA: putative S-layer protein [Candidatus Nanoarchaeia archaeon]|nr:putative S-layer protein [Candidatus Nanoarchaeia archaeon]